MREIVISFHSLIAYFAAVQESFIFFNDIILLKRSQDRVKNYITYPLSSRFIFFNTTRNNVSLSR